MPTPEILELYRQAWVNEPDAVAALPDAIAQARRRGDTSSVAYGLMGLARAAGHRGDLDEARRLLDRCLAVLDPSDMYLWVRVLNERAVYAMLEGEVAVALYTLIDVVLRLEDSTEHRRSLVQALGNLGELLFQIGDVEGAFGQEERALAVGGSDPSSDQSMQTRAALAIWSLATGRTEAGALHARALEDHVTCGDQGRFAALRGLCRAWAALVLQADPVGALGQVDEAREWREHLFAGSERTLMCEVEARSALRAGELGRAHRAAEAGVSHARKHAGPYPLQRILGVAVEVAVARGDTEQIVALARSATGDEPRRHPSNPARFLRVFLSRFQEDAQVRETELTAVNGALRRSRVDLERARDAAEAQAERRLRFLAHMSHELRTPLHGVIGSVELLGQTELDPDQRELVDVISRSSELTLAVVDDVLDLGKAEAGELRLDVEPVRVREVLEAVVLIIGPRAGRIELTVDIDGELPPAVLGDGRRVQQMLLNLLGNAVKYARAECIVLRAQAVGPDRMRLEVEDDGVGIPSEVLDELFEPYRQARGTPANGGSGTGLGLSITRALAEAAGGQAGATSTVGQGSTFWVELPLVAAHVEEAAAPEWPADLKDVSVLLVEDNPVNRRLVSHQLQALGADVRSVADGQQAIDAAWEHSPDVVLMDLHLPILDGDEATRRLRESGFGSPILALTASVLEEHRTRCLDAGMDGVVSKPVRAGDLVEAIIGVLDSQA